MRGKGADILDDESLLTYVSTYFALIKMKLYTNHGNFQSLKLYAASNVAGVTLEVVERKHDGKYSELPQTSLCVKNRMYREKPLFFEIRNCS